MGFDLNTAKPVAPSTPAPRGFDLNTARPVGAAATPADQVPGGGLAGNRNVGKPTEPEDNLLGVLVSPVDAALSAGSSALGGIVGAVAGAGKTLLGGKFGTQEGIREGEEFGSRIAEKIARPPATQTGRKLLEGLATVSEPLVALPSAEVLNMGRAASSANTAIRGLAAPSAAVLDAADAATLANGQRGTLRELARAPQQSTLAGVGAAAASDTAQRAERMAQLPVPLKPTKGMLSRDAAQIQFERETAKNPELGAPLRNRTVELNQGILQNFDAFTDMTGAEGSGLRATGKVVTDALIKKVERAKQEIRGAYDAAAQSAEGAVPVNYSALDEYLKKYQAEADTGNAPVLNTVRRIINDLDPQGTGEIPLRAYNEIRERVGAISKEGTPNAAYRGDLQRIIDEGVEANGGPAYRQARRMYENYMNEFKNAGAVDRLIRTKPGTKDRAVAFEDVVDRAVLGETASADDVRNVKRALTAYPKTAPEELVQQGQQAWKELQGETIRQIKEKIQGTSIDGAGNRPVLASELDKIVRRLDADGRLDLIFGKKGAEQLRDLNDGVREIKTIPPEAAVNHSNTAAVVLAALDALISGASGVPLPIGTVTRVLKQRHTRNKTLKRVDDALNPDQGQR
jgi:hypothetical protein